MRSIAFAAFFVIVLSLSFVAAGFTIISRELVPGPTIEPTIKETLKQYNFVDEMDIEAYQCRLGPIPGDFPEEISTQVCNAQFLDITHDDRLDWADKNAVGGVSWTNYATHHFFVLKNIDKESLGGFRANYVTYNKYHEDEEHHSFYIRDFQSGAWILLDDAMVDRHEQGFLSGGEINQSVVVNYVSLEGEMWFMGTEGFEAGNAIGSDKFSATLTYLSNQSLPFVESRTPLLDLK